MDVHLIMTKKQHTVVNRQLGSILFNLEKLEQKYNECACVYSALTVVTYTLWPAPPDRTTKLFQLAWDA